MCWHVLKFAFNIKVINYMFSVKLVDTYATHWTKPMSLYGIPWASVNSTLKQKNRKWGGGVEVGMGNERKVE